MTTSQKPPSGEQAKTLLHSGRSETVEWLPATVELPVVAEVLMALANQRGGTVLIGVNGKTATGVVNAPEVVDHVLQAALELDPPLIVPLPEIVEYDDKKLIWVQIPTGMPRVYAYGGRYLQRRGAANLALRPGELRRLFIQRGEISFEVESAAGTTLDDLDWDKARAYANKLMPGEDTRQVLLKRGCLVATAESLVPTNAGILLFGKEPQVLFRSSEISAVRFAGETMSDTFTRQDIIGTLPEQIRRAETFLIDNLRKDVRLQKAMAREETYEYPLEAARELVVNAVAHRDYSIDGDGIRLFVFKDRMEVSSPGALAGPVTIYNIREERFSRNPVIVQVLSDMGFVERLGYGVNRVIELMRQHSLQEPNFTETANGFRVTLRNKVVDDATSTSQLMDEEAQPETPETIEELLSVYDGVPINPRQEAALAYLSQPGNTRITNSELQRLYPDVHAETIRRDLADLVTKDILCKMGQKRGSYYVLKKKAEAQDA